MEQIDLEHPEYQARKEMWQRYRDLYTGGEQFRANAGRYLLRRAKEPAEVYQERLNRVFYENYVGSIIDWYAATLFRREPVITSEGQDERAKQFLNELSEDCDLKGTDLPEFFRERLVEALVHGSSYIVVDFPRQAGKPANRAEEDALGSSRAFLAGYTPEEVINWSLDEAGHLDWAVIRTSRLRQDPGKAQWSRETRWVYYDRERFRVFVKGASDDRPRLVDEGFHGLAPQRRVPLFRLSVSEGLWLMNKAALLQMEHFNKSNGLGWALTMGLFAMPVVYSDREWSQIIGEAYYIQLGPEDKFGWTEPEGHVYQIAADNLTRLKDEVYRVCYLMVQAGESHGGSLSQSGLSKQRDFNITNEVLRAYGDAVKEAMKQVLRSIEQARQDGLAVDVSGLDEFDIGDFSAEVANARQLLELGVESPTLKKQIFKKLALKYLCDARPDIKAQVASEIEDRS